MSDETPSKDESSRYVTTKLHRLHYHEAGSGHPVVLLHGSGPGATGWSNFGPNIGPLSRSARVLAFDMPGWGDTSELTPGGERDHVEALLLAFDELGIEQAALVGNSMGGMTSIRFAIEHPERISHLITMGSGAPGINIYQPGGTMSEGMRVLLEAYRDPTPANFKQLVSVMAYDQAFATDELAQQRSVNALAHPEHLDSFFASMRAGSMASFFQLTNRLGEIACPSLIIHGRDDRTVGFENSLRLVAAIPDARLVLFNRCGHWAQLEHATEFNRLVEHFIACH